MPDFDGLALASEQLELLRLNIAQPLDPLGDNMALAESLPLADLSSSERNNFDIALADLASAMLALSARVAALRTIIAGLG